MSIQLLRFLPRLHSLSPFLELDLQSSSEVSHLLLGRLRVPVLHSQWKDGSPVKSRGLLSQNNTTHGLTNTDGRTKVASQLLDTNLLRIMRSNVPDPVIPSKLSKE